MHGEVCMHAGVYGSNIEFNHYLCANKVQSNAIGQSKIQTKLHQAGLHKAEKNEQLNPKVFSDQNLMIFKIII